MLKNNFTKISENVSSAVYVGDCGFEQFLENGGASNEEEIFAFLAERTNNPANLRFSVDGTGCSTMQAKGSSGYFFGRNFDWEDCRILILSAYPDNGYASVSCVDTDFIVQTGGSMPDDQLLLAAHYAPLDGINEKGLCISVNQLPDGMSLHQNTGKVNLTITTAIRLLLNHAATVEEALELLRQYDLHTFRNLIFHYMIADAAGNSVCVEYIDNQMSVIETPVVTNHYLTPGPYFGQGRGNSQQRFDSLTGALAVKEIMTPGDVFAAMESARQGHTQWTVIYDQTSLTASFRAKTDYTNPLSFSLYPKD